MSQNFACSSIHEIADGLASTAYLNTPEYFYSDDVPQVSAAMLQQDLSLPSALKHIVKHGILAIQEVPSKMRLDTSFSRQMSELLRGDSRPDAILCTEVSAIPVSDAVRGVYDGLGLPRPIISTIRADRKSADRFLSSKRSTIFRTHDEKIEMQRLSTLLDGKNSVAIIDQYVTTGRTMQYAVQLLFGATKVNSVSLVQGVWYQEAGYRDSIDVHEVTSKLAAPMYDIGLQAAQIRS